MNGWLVAATVLLVALLPCALVTSRGSPLDRLVGFELSAPIAAMAFLALAQGFDRDVYADVAVAFTLASFVSSVAYVRFLERTL